MPAKYVLTQKGKSFHWSLLATNGRVIATSEVYNTRASAMAGIRSVQKNGATDVVVTADELKESRSVTKRPAKKAASGTTAAKATSTTATAAKKAGAAAKKAGTAVKKATGSAGSSTASRSSAGSTSGSTAKKTGGSTAAKSGGATAKKTARKTPAKRSS